MLRVCLENRVEICYMNTSKKLLRSITVIGILGLALWCGCKKEETQINPIQQELLVRVSYKVDGDSLIASDIRYVNAAGNPFSVNRLQYYLSRFSVQNLNGDWKTLDDIVYLDAFDAEKNAFLLKGIPAGNYQSFRIIIGLEPDQNLSNSLPQTVDNINMIWPEPMGGGYHFMKLEGYFIDEDSKTQGYAMHLGNNPFFSEALISQTFKINSGKDTLDLNMNIAEWFKNPNQYDFTIQGNYSMGKDSSMRKLSENGHDIFSIK